MTVIPFDSGTDNIINAEVLWGVVMDVNTGKLYTEEEAAALPAPRQRNLIWMQGGMDNIEKVSKAVKAQHKKARKQAKKSRRKNRG